MNIAASHNVSRRGCKKLGTCLVWNRSKTRKVRAYSILPNVSYNLTVFVYEDRDSASDKTFFKLYDQYDIDPCTNLHETRLCKPRLVMTTTTNGSVSKEIGCAIEFPDWNWLHTEIVTFCIDTNHVSCEFCNVFCLEGSFVTYYVDGQVSEEYDKQLLFALHTSEE